MPNPSHFMVGNGLPSYVQDNSVVVPVRPDPLFTLICLGAATCENKNIYMKIYSIHNPHLHLYKFLEMEHIMVDQKY